MGDAALQLVRLPPRDKVREALKSAGAMSERATGVEGPSTSASTVRVLTASVLQTQNELNTLVWAVCGRNLEEYAGFFDSILIQFT